MTARRKKKSTPDLVAIKRYKSEILPLLGKAGFSGTLANMHKRAGRSQFLAYLSRSKEHLDHRAAPKLRVLHSHAVTMGLTGTDGRASFSFANEFILAVHTLKVATARFDGYVATLTKKALPRISRMAGEALPKASSDLATLARALLVWLARDRDFKGLEVTRVTIKGRALGVTVRGRRGQIEVDRAALMTLLRELQKAASARKPSGRDLRYALHGHELDAYLEQIAKDDPQEARALWVHLVSPYDVPEAEHPLARLFPKPLALAKKLNVAASGGALVTRTLPWAARKQGSLVNRLVAIRILTATLTDVVGHPRAEELLNAAARVAAALHRERSPLLHECGWLLDDELRKCRGT